MGPFFAFLSSLELRTASRTIWKRQFQPVGWVCPECQSRRRPPARRYQHSDTQGRDVSALKVGFGAAGDVRATFAAAESVKEDSPNASVDENTLMKRSSEQLSSTAFTGPSLIPAVELSHQKESEYLQHQKQEFRDALIRGDPYCLLAAAEAGVQNPNFFSDLPATAITEMLKLLDPDNFVTNYTNVYNNITDETIGNMNRVPVNQLLEDYMTRIRVIMMNLRKTGKKLRLADYRILLRCARACCFGDVADELWNDMKEFQVIPDTACYNHYLAAKCWDGSHVAVTRHTFRVTPFSLRARSVPRRDPRFVNYRVKLGGIKSVMSDIMTDMLRHHVHSNEETFRHVMTSLAREGEMDGVKELLHKIFDIDVDFVMTNINSSNLSKTPRLSADSPFYPTEKLLFTIAHVYGSNNDIPTALRLVDHVSQLYSIPISENTWREMLYWTFILATPSTGARGRKWFGDLGRLPFNNVDEVFKTMVGPPYNIIPTMEMVRMLMSNARRGYQWNLMRVCIHRAKDLLQASVKEVEEAYSKYRHAEWDQMLGIESRERLRRAQAIFESKDIAFSRNHRTMQTFMHWILGKSAESQVPTMGGFYWQRVAVPDIILENLRWLPTSLVRYRTYGGTVELELRTPEETEILKAATAMNAQRFAFASPLGTATGRLINDRTRVWPQLPPEIEGEKFSKSEEGGSSKSEEERSSSPELKYD